MKAVELFAALFSFGSIGPQKGLVLLTRRACSRGSQLSIIPPGFLKNRPFKKPLKAQWAVHPYRSCSACSYFSNSAIVLSSVSWMSFRTVLSLDLKLLAVDRLVAGVAFNNDAAHECAVIVCSDNPARTLSPHWALLCTLALRLHPVDRHHPPCWP